MKIFIYQEDILSLKEKMNRVGWRKMLGVCGLHHPLAAPTRCNSVFLKPPPPQSFTPPSASPSFFHGLYPVGKIDIGQY
jgi:hypothetical protein